MNSFSFKSSTIILYVLVLLLSTAALSSAAKSNGSETYYRAAINCLDSIKKDIPGITKSAEDAAQRFVLENYEIAAVGDPAFETEFITRAGGLMPIKGIGGTSDKPWKTIILVSFRDDHLDADLARAVDLRKQGNIVIAFARSSILKQAQKSGVQFDAIVNNHASDNGGIFKTPDGKWLVPTDATGNLAALWVWTGEFISACTRLGKMPAMWESVVVPGGRERNAKYTSLRFHVQKPIPVKPGQVGLQYLASVRKSLTLIHSQEMNKIHNVAAEAVESRRHMNSLYIYFEGHATDRQLGCAHDPGYFTKLNEGWTKIDHRIQLKPGDFTLGLGYHAIFVGEEYGNFAEVTRKAGAKVAWSISLYNPDELKFVEPGEILIDQHWDMGDAAVQLPGYDVRILPPSGVIAECVLWMINADMYEILKTDKP